MQGPQPKPAASPAGRFLPWCFLPCQHWWGQRASETTHPPIFDSQSWEMEPEWGGLVLVNLPGTLGAWGLPRLLCLLHDPKSPEHCLSGHFMSLAWAAHLQRMNKQVASLEPGDSHAV